MKLRYLPTVEPGLRWFGAYYRRNPQFDRAKATRALANAETALVEYPFSGARVEDFESVRE